MTAHRRHVVTRKSDGAFWCGLFGFKTDPADAQTFDSLRSAYRAIREINTREDLTVEPADWHGIGHLVVL